MVPGIWSQGLSRLSDDKWPLSIGARGATKTRHICCRLSSWRFNWGLGSDRGRHRRMPRDWKLGRCHGWRLNRGERRSDLVGCCRKCRNILIGCFRRSRSTFWNSQKMSTIWAVLSLSNVRDVGPWVCSRLFHNTNFLITFAGLKSRNLLRIERWKRFGTMIVKGLLLHTLGFEVRGNMFVVEGPGSKELLN